MLLAVHPLLLLLWGQPRLVQDTQMGQTLVLNTQEYDVLPEYTSIGTLAKHSEITVQLGNGT